MTSTTPVMKMPEFFVFAKAVGLGFVGAEVWRIAFYLGTNFSLLTTNISIWLQICGILGGALICGFYMLKRNAYSVVWRITRSFRIDLLIAVCIGIWSNILIAESLFKLHSKIKRADPYWGFVIFVLFCAVLMSPLIQQYFPRSKKQPSQLYFISDEEIKEETDDLLSSEAQAKAFAETVLASGAHPGLVFGIDGPWGVGKTSFINLTERHWSAADDRVAVCRFEPLRYASEPDLAERLIRDLSASIQRKVFAPEFQPAASRYSRLLKGKADVSFLGFKLSLEPSQETVDELLDDIDEVLKRINRRIIIVIDDLDRLDIKTMNSVLFATRKTFKLSQATYVLCYDTEILVEGKDEGARAREFLEKFVTVKMSLFIDSSSIRDFLQRDWSNADNQHVSIPSDTMIKFGEILSELASILDSDLAAKYFPVIGDLRKVKRFVNAMLLMRLDESDLGRTDFNKRDLINLMLLHLNYPGMFRHIYAEETEGRRGMFSVRRKYEQHQATFINTEEFTQFLSRQEGTKGFLMTQLFDVSTLELADGSAIDESVLATRACFNESSFRNLEAYLKLIVRFVTPEPQETFVLYQNAVNRVNSGTSISEILSSNEFKLDHGEHAHDQFWRVLVSQAYSFTQAVADDAIETLVDYLPRYAAIRGDEHGLRQRSIYSLLLLLDRAGWGRTSGRRRANTSDNIVEIALRIFGEGSYENKSLLQRLISTDRGILGWNDLMLFRLQCSQDRAGQLYNLHSALIIHQDRTAPTTGLVSTLAQTGMRKLSQEIFAFFKHTYIIPQRNFYSEARDTPVTDFLGEGTLRVNPSQNAESTALLFLKISKARSLATSFVIYQLTNSLPPNGSGVGCGYYDESGARDSGDIGQIMNEYVFDFCFNPRIDERNIFHFLNHCLSHLSNSFFSGEEEEGYFASKTDIPGGLNPKEMGRYWSRNREYIRAQVEQATDQYVITHNYTASYEEYLPKVFVVLDELAEEAALDTE